MTTPHLTQTQISEIQTSLNERRPKYQELTSLLGQRRAGEMQLTVLQRLQELIAGATAADAVLALGQLKEALRPLEAAADFIARYERDKELVSLASASAQDISAR